MSGEENFKKTLNDLLNSKEFSFEEKNWQDAEKFIAASRRKRRLRPLFWIIPAAIIGGASWLFLSDNTTSGVSSLTPDKVTQVEQTPVTSDVAETNQPENTVSSGKANPLRTSETPAAHENTGKEADRTTADQPEKNIPATEAKPDNEKSRTHAPDKQAPGKQGNPAVSFEPGKKKTAEKTKSPEGDQPDLSPVPGVVTKTADAAKDGQNAEKPAAGEEPETDDKPAVTGVGTANTQSQNTATAQTENTPSTDTGTNTTETPQPVAAAEASVSNAATVATARPDTDYVALKRPLLTIEGGANLARGWNSGEQAEAGGINPLIGMTYFQNLNAKLAISAGLQYYSIGNLKASSYTSRVVRYGLGEQSEVTVFTPTRLHYMALPLQVNYQLGAANTVGAGINIAYLLTVSVNKEEYTESIAGQANHRTSKDRGYTQGFKPFDNQVCIFYRRRFLTNAFAGAELYYGLAPVKDSFFNATGKERNMGLKITLGYYLLKSK